MLCPHCQSEVSPTASYCVRCGQAVGDGEPERAYQYEAFISYRHVSRDQRVARRIQRAIEGRAVPKGLREAVGRPRLGKCFRDEDELPTDASLNTMITDALERSRWLIVVCSPAMRESRWCAQEVKTFCELHGRDRVLLALSDGEPNEAFPLILQSRATVLPDGTVVDEPFEPIAADLREGSGKRFSAEALRLVAPLMGCGYDDLRQRERMRRARLVSGVAAAIAAVSVAFGAFSYRQQLQIDANYQASLRNQSAYLSTEAAELLSTGDRMQAVQVAYAALPVGDHTSRPYVPAAQMALADALQVYPMGGQWHSCYAHLFDEAFLHKVMVAPDGSRCAVTNSEGTLFVWDTSSGKHLRIEAPDHEEDFIYVSDPRFVGDELICSYDSLLVRYDPATGEVREAVDVEEGYDRSQWPMYTSTYNTLAVSADDRLVALVGNFQFDSVGVVIYDLSSRKVSQAVSFAVPEDAEVNYIFDKHVASFDADGSHLIVAQSDLVVSLDVATGKVTTLVSENGVVGDLQVTDDAVIIGFCKAADEEGATFDTSVCALDAATLKERWSYHLDGQAYYYHSTAPLTSRTQRPLPLFFGMVDAEGGRNLLVTIGSTVHLIDPDTGASTYDGDVGKQIVGADLTQISRVNGYGLEDGRYLILVTIDGQVITHSIDRDIALNSESGHRTSTGDGYLTQACLFSCEGMPYLVTESGSKVGHVVVWRCDHLQTLPGYEEVADSASSLITRSVDGTYLVPYSWYAADDEPVRVFDAARLSYGATLSLPDEVTSAILCFSDVYDDVLYTLESTYETTILRSHDPATGACGGEVRGILTDSLFLDECAAILQSHEGKLCLLCLEEGDGSDDEHVVLRTVDARTLEAQSSLELDTRDGSFSPYGLCVTAATSELFACAQDSHLLVWRRADGSLLDCDLAHVILRDGYLVVADPDGSTLLVATGNTLQCYGADGSLQWEQPFSIRTNGYVAFAPDGPIICQDRSGELMLLDAATGEIITSTPTSYFLDGISWFSADGTRLYTQAYEATDTSGFFSLLVIHLDPDEFGVETAAYYANAMTPDAERFICSDDDSTYTLPYWSLEDLAARAEEITAGHELTEAERRRYLLE